MQKYKRLLLTKLFFLISIGLPITGLFSSAGASQIYWSDAVELSSTEVGLADPRTIISGDGRRITAIWREQNAQKFWALRARNSINLGGSWSELTTIFEREQNIQSFSVDASSDGNRLIVAWKSSGLLGTPIQVRTSIDGGITWVSPIQDLTESTSDAHTPQVVCSEDCQLVTVVWEIDGLIQSRGS